MKIGDVVQLKSGGPDMTVLEKTREEDLWWLCAWFHGANVVQESFPEAALDHMKTKCDFE